MIIKSIRVNNFLSYEDSGEVVFDRGTTVIIGENGAGKSAIIDGIIFSLFGKNERSKKIEELRRWGVKEPLEVNLVFEEGGKQYRVERSWGRTRVTAYLYAIEYGGERLIARGATEVNAKIEEILGLDSNTMVNTIYLKQGEIEGLLDMKPAERKEMIDRLLGINKFEDVYNLMRELISLVVEEKSNVEKDEERSESDLKNLKNRKKEKKDSIEEYEERIREIDEKLKNLNEERKELEDKIRNMEDKKEKSREIENKIKIIEDKIKEKEKIIEEYEKMKKELKDKFGDLDEARKKVKNIPLLEELKELKNQIKNLDKDAKSLEKDRNFIEEIANKAKKEYSGEVKESPQDILKNHINWSTRVKAAIDEREKKLKREKEIKEKLNELVPEGYDYKGYLQKIEEEINALKKERENKTKDLGKSKGNLERYEEWLKSIEDVNQCPLCGREFDEKHSRDSVRDRLITMRKEEESKISALEKELEEISTKIKNLEDSDKKLRGIPIEELERLKEEIKSLEENIDTQLRSLEVIQSKALKLYNELNEEIKKTKDKIEELEKEKKEIIDKLGRVPEDLDDEIRKLREGEKKLQELEIKEKDYNKAQKDRDDLLSQKKEYEEKLKSIGYDKGEHEKLNENWEKIKEEINKLKGERNTKEKDIENEKKKLQDIKEEIKNKKSELENIKVKREKLEKIITDLNKIRGGFNKDNIPELIRKIAIPSIEKHAKSYASQFNFGISDIRINNDFSIDVYFGDRKFSLTMLSGGQKTAVAIALRLGIARYLGKRLTSVIMDEPTASLDERRRTELLELLREFMSNPETLAQLIIVTHHRELEQVADTLYTVKFREGVSEIK